MSRLLGPSDDSRFVYVPTSESLGNAASHTAVVYASATGGTLANIATYDGTDTPGAIITNSQLTVTADSLLPQFWFPEDDVDTVYVEVAGGTRIAVHADVDNRVDRISGGVNAPLMSTGLLFGGAISVNDSNPKAIDIAPYVGYVVDYITDPFNPTSRRVTSNVTTTVALDAAGQARFVTWWMIDGTGTVTQQADRPSNTQRRTHIQLGFSIYDTTLGVIFVSEAVPVFTSQIVNQFFDLLYALGSFSTTGNVISSNGANLTFAKTIGRAFTPSFRYELTPGDPHVFDSPAQVPVTFRHITRSSNVALGTFRTTIDVANYDLNGVITPAGGGAGSATVFRVWLLGSASTIAQVLVQYGQTVYSSLSNAVAAIGRTGYVPNSDLSGQAALLGHIVATRTATNLSDPAQASVIPSNAKFLSA